MVLTLVAEATAEGRSLRFAVMAPDLVVEETVMVVVTRFVLFIAQRRGKYIQVYFSSRRDVMDPVLVDEEIVTVDGRRYIVLS